MFYRMATETDRESSVVSGVTGGLRRVVRGTDDTRMRAIWRVLIAGVFIVLLQEPVAVAIVSVLGVGGVFLGISQAAVFAIILVGWAAYVDRRPVWDYGFSLSRSWWVDGVVGFVGALLAFGVWLGLGASLGWAEVNVAMTAPEGSALLGLAAFLVGGVLNVWVQQTTFIGIVLKNAAEGLSSRGVTAPQAVTVAWVVAVLNFTLVHQPSELGHAVNLLIGLSLYGLLYLLTGELALPIGVHAGINYAGGVLVASPSVAADRASLIEVTNSLSGVIGSLNAGAVPQVVIAFLLVLGWLKWRRGELRLYTDLVHWTKR
jgi:membrane protease YdiL (CAAX protease family)